MKNEVYEKIIWNEIIVDCNDDYDRNMSWYNYLEDEIEFPFIAYIPVKMIENLGGQVFKKIKVIGLSTTEDSNFETNFKMKVEAEFDRYIMEFPLSQLKDVRAEDSVIEVIELWKYWVGIK